MTIKIAPFKVNLKCERKNGRYKEGNSPITYWGIYLNNRQISYAPNKELAEKTKVWIEKWVGDRS